MAKVKIKTGDKVLVIAGDDKKKEGVVKAISHKKNIVIVEGVNIIKRAVKPEHNNNENFLKIERPIHLSKVKLVKSGEKKAEKKVKKESKKG